jgi:hypothetical protein
MGSGINTKIFDALGPKVNKNLTEEERSHIIEIMGRKDNDDLKQPEDKFQHVKSRVYNATKNYNDDIMNLTHEEHNQITTLNFKTTEKLNKIKKDLEAGKIFDL